MLFLPEVFECEGGTIVADTPASSFSTFDINPSPYSDTFEYLAVLVNSPFESRPLQVGRRVYHTYDLILYSPLLSPIVFNDAPRRNLEELLAQHWDGVVTRTEVRNRVRVLDPRYSLNELDRVRRSSAARRRPTTLQRTAGDGFRDGAREDD